MIRRRKCLPIAIFFVIALLIYTLFTIPTDRLGSVPYSGGFGGWEEPRTRVQKSEDPQPQPARGSAHPIQRLVADAEHKLEDVKARQSRNLADAVAEYRRRYGMPPPPNFDKWFAFARDRRVQLPDEFDMIHDMLRPFWGLKPKTIRDRVGEALGFSNSLIGFRIRNGKVTRAEGGDDWQRDATKGMMADFIQYLPDMDLAFNMHDEPRVVVPHDDLDRLVQTALEVKATMAEAATAEPVNAFTKSADLGPGLAFEETALTRFNVFAHQPTWTESRMSCPADSPSRALEDNGVVDDVSQYAFSDLGFVYNVTAMSDICLSPSLHNTFGFFDRPNAFNVVHDLVPVFSQSKISSYSDILYPSPWYWAGKVAYDPGSDMDWEKKADRLYWRGSTTGGFSRNGGWRRQHRQHFVRKVNSPGSVRILVDRGDRSDPRWGAVDVARTDFADLVDVQFSHVGQCDPGDCEAQRQFFTVTGRVDQQDAWRYKFLLDIDGNAFSGRFYAFLRSRSLVFKMAYFREWHVEWLHPWAHYVPLSLPGEDWLEAVRYFRGDSGHASAEHLEAGADKVGERGEGEKLQARDESVGGGRGEGARAAERIATRSREWADKVLRKEDMETWFFRLLLEYGRVIDDNRENIGFSMD